MSVEERFMFHDRLGNLIVCDYARRRHEIPDDDPNRDEKRRKNKDDCAEELRRLNRFFFGQKQVWACDGCPLMRYWAENEAEKMERDNP